MLLDCPDLGVRVPPMIWLSMYKFSADAVLTVFASTPYEPGDYIRDYQAYLAEVVRQILWRQAGRRRRHRQASALAAA